MSGADAFFDTNVVLYLLSANSKKADRAETLIGGGGVISVQVLNEFASVASRKLAMSLVEIRELLEVVRTVCSVESISETTHDCGFDVYERYGFSIYDSMIVASALLANCRVLYSEDLQDGQRIEERLTIRNPFKLEPSNWTADLSEIEPSNWTADLSEIVHMANREKIQSVFTLDRRDFSVHRLTGGRAFTIIPEWAVPWRARSPS